jgi:hypothetical protein
MTWTAPPVFTSGNVLTAAQQNILADDLRETAAALAATAGTYPVATGANALAMRECDSDVLDSIATTPNTSYVHTSMPTVVLATGAQALCFLYSYVENNTNSQTSFYGVAVSGGTTQAANDNRAITAARFTSDFAVVCSSAILITALNVTANSFVAGVRVTGGTGTFDHRRIAVLPF